MIYCVEDDAGIRELVVYTLQNTGLEARGFADGEALFAALREQKPDLLLLDIMLPGEDGISILRRLRAVRETAKLPVILLTAKNTEYDKVVGLDSGADDYVAKPFGMMELVARIRAVLRRTQDSPPGEGEMCIRDRTVPEGTASPSIGTQEVRAGRTFIVKTNDFETTGNIDSVDIAADAE